MFINTKNQTVFQTLPTHHWLGPNRAIPLTEADLGATMPDGAVYLSLFDFFNVGVSEHVTKVTRQVGFDDISRCALVLPSSHFYAAAQALVAWYNAVWAYVAQQQALLLAGQREFVPLDEFILNELPQLADFMPE